MSHISDVARKIRRALRNDTGVHLSSAELQAFASLGALDLVSRAENEELCPSIKPLSPAANKALPSSTLPPYSAPPRSSAIPDHLGPAFIDALRLGC